MNKKNITSLNGIRALAFIGVVAGHCGLTSTPLVVSVFLMLSGFLMTYSYFDKDINCNFIDNIKFAVKKIKQLIPLNIFLLTFNFILYFLLFGMKIDFIKKFLWVYVVDVFMLQGWLLDQKMILIFNGLSWYLSIAMFLYFVFPYILKFVKKIKNNLYLFIGLIFVYLIQTIVGIIFTKMNFSSDLMWCLTYVNPLYRLGDFLVGVFLGCIFINLKNNNLPSLQINIFEIIAFVLILLNIYLYKQRFAFFQYDVYKNTLGHIPFAAIIIFVFAFNGGGISKILGTKFFKFFADVSPFGFLIHYQLVEYLKMVIKAVGFSDGLKLNLILFITLMIITILLSKLYVKIIKK